MFALEAHQHTVDPLALIADDERIVLFEDVPVLFTGRNSCGQPIIGSSIDEDGARGIEWYFHLIVTEAEFAAYIGGQVAYRQLLENSSQVFAVGKQADATQIYRVNFADVPEAYKPLVNSFFPGLSN